MAASAPTDVGSRLKQWRERRRLTRMEIALDAGVSARHLSFVETGRSKPGRAMLLRVTERLDVPYRERNQILLAAGHAPAFPERPLADAALSPVRDALDRVLAAHDPYPGMAFDRAWNLVAANQAMTALVGRYSIEPWLLERPINALRIGIHPGGLAPYITNLPHWRAHFIGRLADQVALTADPELTLLLEELTSYPAGEEADAPQGDIAASDVLGPVRFRAPDGGEWAFFGMFAGFDTPFEVTTSELALELLFPADQATRAAFDKETR